MRVSTFIIMLIEPNIICHDSQIGELINDRKVLKLLIVFKVSVIRVKLIVEVLVLLHQFEIFVDPLIVRIFENSSVNQVFNSIRGRWIS